MKLAVLALIFSLSAVGCSSGATPASEPPPAVPSETASAPPTASETTSPGPTAAPATPAPTADVSAATEAVRQYLEENFGAPGFETPWWQHITGVSIESGVVVMATDLTEVGEDATGICAAASGFIFLGQGDPQYGLTGVEVRGEGGQSLVLRTDVAQPC